MVILEECYGERSLNDSSQRGEEELRHLGALRITESHLSLPSHTEIKYIFTLSIKSDIQLETNTRSQKETQCRVDSAASDGKSSLAC